MIRVDIGCCGNLYFHQMTFTEAGDVVPTHDHAYDHVLQIQRGKVRVWAADSGPEDIAAPAAKLIPAGIAHDLEALEPNTICCCIHNLRDKAGNEFPYQYRLTSREMAEATGRL